MDFTKDLNEHQLEAVTTPLQHVRVIAGAGSGKTRVLTYRIAYLLQEVHVPSFRILAITFTNKVAGEMLSRLSSLCPEYIEGLTVKTFHAFAALFLRREISILGYPASFTILDDEDSEKMIKDIASRLGYKKSDPIVKKAQSYISKQKNLGIEPDEITIVKERFEGEKDCLEIYNMYEEDKRKMFTLDFDDLLLKTNYILTTFEDIRRKWQERISYILVDEFQDTNDVEYKLIKLLMKPTSSLYVVGDPDQTIYTWRGANQDIILHLEKDFYDMTTIILDCNYRSTQTILDSANKLISHNKFRVEKNLYTLNDKGEPIVTKYCPSSASEADYVVREIEKLHNIKGVPYRDIVILYRSNYISLEFETALTSRGIAYRLYGGTKFYQRREIKDVLAYFHLIVNTKDDVAYERIINVPKRGVGETSLLKLKVEASEHNMSMYDYISSVEEKESCLPAKVINSLRAMNKLIDICRDNIAKNEEVFSKILEDMLHSLKYYDYLIEDEDGDDRLENVKALFADLRHFLEKNPESTFDEYLQNITLLSAQDEIADGDYVTLMTVHTAKGLEFPNVFIVRFNDTVFPSGKSLIESGVKGLEEERRLAYVAMTRAKKRLYITSAGGFSYVAGGSLVPSQFYRESGNNVITGNGYNPYIRPLSPNQNKVTKPVTFGNVSSISSIDNPPSNGVTEWHIGDTVIHKTLGRGKVVSLEGDSIIKVNFEENGIKSILSTHPSVKKGD